MMVYVFHRARPFERIPPLRHPQVYNKTEVLIKNQHMPTLLPPPPPPPHSPPPPPPPPPTPDRPSFIFYIYSIYYITLFLLLGNADDQRTDVVPRFLIVSHVSGVAQRERTRSPAATVHPLVARRELVHRRDLGRIQIDLRVDPPSRGCRRGSVEETSWASSSLTVSYFIRTTEEKGVRACAQQQKRKESKYYESMENIGGGQDDGVQREKKAVGRGSRHDDGRFVYYSSRPPSPRHPDTPNGTTHIKYRMRTHTRWGIWRRERRRPRPTWIVGRRGLRRRRSSLFSRINRMQATDCCFHAPSGI